MESLKAIHQSVQKTLYEWNYEKGDIVHITDLGYAIYHSLDNMSCLYKYHILCMCLNKTIVDMGDGLYMINEESNT